MIVLLALVLVLVSLTSLVAIAVWRPRVPSWRKTTVWKETRRNWRFHVARVMMFCAIVLIAWTPSAAAHSHLGPVSALESYIWYLFIGAIVLGAIVWLGGRAKGEGKTAALSSRSRSLLSMIAGLLAILFVVALVSLVTSPVGPQCDTIVGNAIPDCVTPHEFTVTISIGVTAGSTVPAGSYDSCDTEVGGTTGEWTATEGTADLTSNRIRALVAIDTDLATTAALWSEPNCLELDHDLHLNTPVDQNGDGVADSITYYGGIDSISRTTLPTDGSNGTVNGVGFVRDGIDETADWLILWKNDAGTWIPACPEAKTSSSPPTSCGDVAVGAHTGSAADDDVDLYIILEDRGLWGYQEPAVGAFVVINYHIAGKSYTVEIILNSRGTTNLS